MSAATTPATAVSTDQIDWPEEVPIAAERVIAGTPRASTLVVEDGPGRQLGLWRITPGEFTTDHAGYTEFIHVLSGRGELVDEAGTVTPLSAGATVLTPSGWRGRWVVAETLTKVFTVIDD